MTYYIFIQDNKINGAGQCKQFTEGVLNLEVEEELYNSFVDTPNKYIYQDNEIILNPNFGQEEAQKERERLDMLSLTKREVFLALYKDKGITPEKIKAQITNPEALIEFDYANDYYRGNPQINVIGQALGYSTEQLDYLFEHGELPEKSQEAENEETF